MNFIQAVAAARRVPVAPAGIVTSGLIWHIDPTDSASYPGSGSTIYDLVGSNNGTFEGGVYVDANGHLILDGVNDSVHIGSVATGSALSLGGQSWTIQAYANALRGLNFQHIYSQFRNGTVSDRVIMYRYANSQMCYGVYVGSTPYDNHNDYTNTMPDNTWVLFTWTYDHIAGVVSIYKNGGTSLGSDSGVSIGSYDRELRYGSRGTSVSANEFRGKLGCAMQYNRVLSASEITHNYNVTKADYGL